MKHLPSMRRDRHRNAADGRQRERARLRRCTGMRRPHLDRSGGRTCQHTAPLDQGMTFTPEEREALRFSVAAPACAFCDAPDADDTYSEELYPDAPCCSDEAACYARMEGNS